jgi:glycosyltransferase involved in cell wall biosynthesis
MTPLSVLHVAYADVMGGASRASYRIHRALVDHAAALGISSRMQVAVKSSADDTIADGAAARSRLRRSVRYHLHRWRTRRFATTSDAFHAIAWPSTGFGAELARSDADLLHLHWLGRDVLSVEEIGALRQPIVWTLHDMWPICGAETYSDDRRFADGYTAVNRPSYERGPDLNRWTWQRKQRAWRRPMHLVCTSQWMADRVDRSALMRHWPVSVIPYPIDLAAYAPMEQGEARARLGLPADVPIILFGAIGGLADRRKGGDVLLDALTRLRREARIGGGDFHLVVFGQDQPTDAPRVEFPVHYAGALRDDASLRLHYAAADVMVVPSRQEALGQTACEAMACGTPVVASRVGGLSEVVAHCETGYLAGPQDAGALATGIEWVLSDRARRAALGASARAAAERRWQPERVARLYADVYHEVRRSIGS